VTTDLKALAAQTQAVYERRAAWFADHRPKALIEKAWLDRFCDVMPDKASILDLGCGAGKPIAAYFLAQGHRVIGLDASKAMIELAREALPNGDWRAGDMRALDLEDRFDGIIGWHSFFHLTQDEQRATLPKIAAHLKPRGALMLTVGTSDGEVEGQVADDPIYHSSLNQDEYRAILARLGLEVLAFKTEDPDCAGSTILLAQRTS
jgi:SAM-dependent methyltransferase